ncbi:lysophospholipase [Sphingosinicellaceae bacterium]|nr:lysophospholipase [Sphingosinicellaceae bacterium]
MRDATNFSMPVFIMAGRNDRNTDGQLQHEYFDRITAPAKRFTWFEASAHSPPFEQAAPLPPR